MPLRLVTAPASEPVTLAEAKAHLRLETTADDDYVTALITAARQYAERICWRGFVTQTWELTLDGFPGGVFTSGVDGYPPGLSEMPGSIYGAPVVAPSLSTGVWRGIELPMGKLASVTSVQYVDTDGNTQTLATSVYDVDTINEPGRIHLAYGQVWPDTQVQWNAVTITYVVGEAVADVPQPIKQALYLLVSQMYENRTPEVFGQMSRVQFAVDALLSPYRYVRI